MCIVYYHYFDCQLSDGTHIKPDPGVSFVICPKGSADSPLTCPERLDDKLFCGPCPQCRPSQDEHPGETDGGQQGWKDWIGTVDAEDGNSSL